jgi:hypothetical protein
MARDGKDKFYRTLNLDRDAKDILKWFRKIKQQMINEDVPEEEEETDDRKS